MKRRQEFLKDLFEFCWVWLENEPELRSDDIGFLVSQIEKHAEAVLKDYEERLLKD